MSILASAPVAYGLIIGSDWRMRRLMAYFNPDAYAIDRVLPDHSGRDRDWARAERPARGSAQGRQQLGYMPGGSL